MLQKIKNKRFWRLRFWRKTKHERFINGEKVSLKFRWPVLGKIICFENSG
jgi:hypothetical protein